MDRAQTRALLVLSALVLAVGGALYFQGEPPEEPVDPEATSTVWEIPEETPITAVRVEREAGVLRLENVDGTWFVREPFEGRADDDQAKDLVNVLTDVDLGIPVVQGADAAEFGLAEPPNARVAVTLADGSERKLDVGIASPVGFRTYMRAADGGIVAVNGDANRPLQAEAARFRDRRIFRFDPAAVREVSVTTPEGTLRVHGEGKDWWVDGFSHADADRVDDLVVGLLDLRFDTVRDGITVEPIFRVAVKLADGQSVGLDVGDPAAPEVLALTTDGRGGTVWPESLQQLGRGPSDVGWRTAFGIRLDVADSVAVTSGGRTVEARRNGAAWTAEGLDEGAVYVGMDTLSRVPVEYRREAPPAPAPIETSVTVAEGERSWTIEVGPPLGDGFRAARDPAGGAPYRIASDALDAAIEALRPPP